LYQLDITIQLPSTENGTALDTMKKRMFLELGLAVSSLKQPAIKSWTLPWRGLDPTKTLCYTRKLHFITDPSAEVNPNPDPLSVTSEMVIESASPMMPKQQLNPPFNCLMNKKLEEKAQQAQQAKDQVAPAQLQGNDTCIQPSLSLVFCTQPQVLS
jgi:hypothetical protein